MTDSLNTGSEGGDTRNDADNLKNPMKRSSVLSTVPSSSAESRISTFSNMWTHLSKKYWVEEDAFEENEDEEEEQIIYTFSDTTRFCYQSSKVNVTNLLNLCKRNVLIPLVSVATFAFLFTTGLLIVRSYDRSYREDLTSAAHTLAKDTGDYFSDELDKSLVPMFSLAQVVKHDDEFRAMSRQVGNLGEAGAAPALENVPGFRNLNGICDKPELQAKLDELVQNILGDASMRGTVANMQLAPIGVSCLSSPLINNRDFESGVFNTTKMIGSDWLHSSKPEFVAIAKETINSPSNEITFMGPMTLKSPQGEILSKSTFCVHLAVNLPSERLLIEGRSYPSWGFVRSFINWEHVLKKKGIHDKFSDAGMIFQLYRTDTVTDEMNYVQTKIVVLAESENAQILSSRQTISVPVETSNSVWNVKVGYVHDISPPWLASAKFAVLIISAIMSIMVLVIYAEKYKNQLLLYKMLPKNAIKKLNRGQTVVDRYNVVTIFFSDIVGFTSLAVTMRPVEVMQMLNDLYKEFDKLVAKHKVYKVETIGDAYMVIGGAPNRCLSVTAAENVAVFALEAIECVRTFRIRNGGRIFIRAGLASGPVVAGVVGDAMPRYCFFGDTVNFASRMESTSRKMQIQCCDTTSRLLANASSHDFVLEERVDEAGNAGVEMKGKGLIHTSWIREARERNNIAKIDFTGPTRFIHSSSLPKNNIVQNIIAQDWMDLGKPLQPSYSTDFIEMKSNLCALLNYRLEKVVNTRNTSTNSSVRNLNSLYDALASYVERICDLYIINDYHNFHHAYHVTLSASKLVEMMIINERILHDDYLTHFALVFSALVHDVGHKGIPNLILVNLKDELAKTYNNTSIAEKNSLKISFDILNEDCYSHLRRKLFGSDNEHFAKFQDIARTAILCTDVFNADRMALAKERWEIAFSENKSNGTRYSNYPKLKNNVDDLNLLEIDQICIFPQDADSECLKKTSVIEHLIQVADVAHSFQSWEVFIKWNYRLVKELLVCHQSGWADDVTTTWNDGQNEFTDTYVLPLISRVHGMGIISEADNNTLHEAVEHNRKMWIRDGEKICAIMQYGIRMGEDEDVVLGKLLQVA